MTTVAAAAAESGKMRTTPRSEEGQNVRRADRTIRMRARQMTIAAGEKGQMRMMTM